MVPVPILYITLLFGFIMGYILYELFRFRLGGVIAVPLLVIYTLKSAIMLPIFVFSIAWCVAVGLILQEKTLLYGRRLLYFFLMLSIIITTVMLAILSPYLPVNIGETVVFTIFPGLIAYNITKESYDLDTAGTSISMLILDFLIIYLVANILMLIW